MSVGGDAMLLVADVGGTNARLGLFDGSDRRFVEPPRTFLCAEHASLEALVGDYLAEHAASGRPTAAAIAVAGPVTDGAATLTNLGWTVSEAVIRDAGVPSCRLLNDYEALAYAVPGLSPTDAAPIGGGLPDSANGTVAVMGPGTGFGATALCIDRDASSVLSTEAGHIAFAPRDDCEVEVWRRLSRRFGRVSVERILSGPGLLNLHAALCEIEGRETDCDSPPAVLAQAAAGEAGARATLERFCAILGAVAGDLALAYGAKGGVLIAGGLAPRMMDVLGAGGFRAAFEAKGRFASYLAAVPTAVVTNPYFALLGAAASLASHR